MQHRLSVSSTSTCRKRTTLPHGLNNGFIQSVIHTKTWIPATVCLIVGYSFGMATVTLLQTWGFTWRCRGPKLRVIAILMFLYDWYTHASFSLRPPALGLFFDGKGNYMTPAVCVLQKTKCQAIIVNLASPPPFFFTFTMRIVCPGTGFVMQ